jgi:NAD(P)-dependent dehydrogenase (short-subunit alcohol dehydrogenase family)
MPTAGMPAGRVAGKVAIVTGAGSGIGAALAAALAAAGAAVLAGDIDAAAAAATAARIRADGHPAVAAGADAASAGDIGALISLAAGEFGPVDIYVANAGITGPSGLDLAESDWDRVLDVNLRAHIRAATLLVPQWLQRGGGHFVSVASAAGLLTQIGAAGYAVSKHAAVGFAEWLSITYGDRGIGVSCVCPMGVNTPLLGELADSPDPAARLAATAVTSAGRVLEPRDVATATVDAIAHGRFLVLPHPEVLDMYRGKGADYDGWIAGMRRYQARLAD